MSRILIRNGELVSSYEPYALPGAFIVQSFAVVDSTGHVPPSAIQWDGPGIWRDSRDGVPEGYRALWLGAADTARPFVVYVSEAPTPESDVYDRAYRAAFSGKRKPRLTERMTATEIEARLQGWADRQRSCSTSNNV